MLKKIILYLSVLLIITIGNSKKSYHNFLYDLQHREITGKSIKKIAYKDQDFSNMNFCNWDFRGCTFENVDFTNSDLSGALFEGAKFIKDVNLEGAILYYPLDDKNQPIIEEAFKVKNWNNHLLLIKQYSELIKQSEAKLAHHKNAEYNILISKTQCLNKIFSSIKFDLSHGKLSSFHLHGINLQNANLQDASLTYTNLKNVNLQGANLKNADLKWSKIEATNLQEANLKNADLSYIKLNKVNFQRANLQGVDLYEAHLQEVNFQEANLQQTKLLDCKLNKINLIQANIDQVLIDRSHSLPLNCTEEDLIEMLNLCTYPKVKNRINAIIEGRKTLVDNPFNLK